MKIFRIVLGLVLLLIVLCSQPIISQSNTIEFASFQIDDEKWNALKNVAKFNPELNVENGVPISIPDPKGMFTTYYFFKNNILSRKTATDYPGINTLTGYAANHKDHFVNIVIHERKLSGIILKNGSPVIELTTTENNEFVASYAIGKSFECLTQQGNFRPPSSSGARSASNGTTLKNYTIGIVITDEFETANGNGATAIASAVNVVSQMSAIYKRDMAIEFTADVRPETAAFNINPASWGAVYGGQVIAAYFSINDYDLGHVFHFSGANTGWGGAAALGAVCSNIGTPPNKSQSWSQGQDLSYSFISTVVHEVAHMFNVTHTYNSNNAGFCNSQRANATAFEPGAGISLMAYPGVCPFPGIGQNLTDASGNVFYATIPFFHVASLEQMVTYANGTGNSCATGTTSGNTPPIANANPCNANTPTIPANTPFELIGLATDADNDNLTYSWEQVDAGPPYGGPNAACGSTSGPIFRVYEPSTSPVRSFPSLTYILNHANVPPLSSIGGCLPTVSRNINFKLSVRDNNASGGGIHCSQITVAVNASIGPLAVTSPNTAVTWAAGSSQTITWSGSNTSSICSTVNIKLSIDGGNSYPYTLAAATSNDGTETLTIPANIPNTTSARIRVESSCWDCVRFFDVSNANFTVTSSCLVNNSILCPVNAIVLPQGDIGLDFNISNFFGYEGSSFAFNVVSTNPNMGLSREDAPAGSGVCEASGFNNKFKTSRLVVNQTGLYTFNVSGSSSFPAVNLYLASTFNPSTPCLGWVGSNLLDAGGGFTSILVDFSVNLIACTEYIIVGSDLNAPTPFSTSINISGPGTKYFTQLGPNSPYNGYTFVAVNSLTTLIASVSSSADFTTLPSGNYCIYGINYQTTLTPSSWIGQSLATILESGNCLLPSTNCKPVTVTSTCSSIVSNANDSGPGSLRDAVACNTEGSTITFSPTVSEVILTSGLTITQNITLQGQSNTFRPEIRTSASGITINAGKTLMLQNVDITHTGSQTINGSGSLLITGTTIGKP